MSFSALALSRAIAAGEVTPAALMAATYDRIEAVNPGINALVGVMPRAQGMALAEAPGPRRGWLHGIPFAVKDLVAVAGLPWTEGSPVHAARVAAADDLLAARLRTAGAIIIAKTNVPEFGLGSQTSNPVWGPTRNPYDPGRTAGGSSGGAAAALAAGLVPVADGSDMMGSLRNPAAFCNVYGFRPTVGIVPGGGEELVLHPLSTNGPMARDVADLAALLGTLAGADPATMLGRDWAPGPLEVAVAGRRIGWVGDWAGAWPIEDGILALGEDVAAVFEGLGVAVEPVVPAFDWHALWRAWIDLRAWAVAGSLGPLVDAGAPVKAEVVWEVARGRGLSLADVTAAGRVRSDWLRCLARLFQRYDALMWPSAQVWPFDVGTMWPRAVAGVAMTTYHQWMAVVVPASLAACPALAIPAGFGAGGLPMGMQLVGRSFGDLGLLQLGHAYHQATEWPQRRPPG